MLTNFNAYPKAILSKLWLLYKDRHVDEWNRIESPVYIWLNPFIVHQRLSHYKLAISSVQSLSCFQHFVTPWTAARQASLSITISQSLLKLMSIESVMPSNHHILCRPLLLLPSVFPSISSVQFSHSVMSNSLWPHGLHHARLPCPSASLGACSDSCPSSQQCRLDGHDLNIRR